VLKGMEGKKVENPPDSLTIYELCKTFSCLPSQLDQEDNRIIEEMLIIMNAVSEYERKEDRKTKREQAKNKLGGGQQRR
jgi:hypothetical protein